MKDILSDTNHQRDFLERGYTNVSQVLTSKEITYLLKELKTLSPNDKFAPDENGMFGFTFHCTFLDSDVNYKRRAQNLICEVFSKHIERLLNGYKILTGNFFVKPPGTGELMVHRNFTFVEDITDKTVTLWCPLVDVDESNGTIHFIEGSHNIVPHITTPTATPFFQPFESVINKYAKPTSLKAGEGLIFDDNLLHGSANNKSNNARYVVQIVCVPKDRKSVVYFLDPNGNDNRFEVFEINSDFFIENTLTDILTRPDHLKSLGFVENKNTVLSEDEFISLVKQINGIEFEKVQFINNGQRFSLLNRIRSLIKAKKD